MTTVHCYGDSGPYGVWVEGASRSDRTYDVPDEIWREFEAASSRRQDAEDRLQDYCTLLDMNEHIATHDHGGFVHPDHLVRCVTCGRGWYLNQFASR